jgi:hypothetical protein
MCIAGGTASASRRRRAAAAADRERTAARSTTRPPPRPISPPCSRFAAVRALPSASVHAAAVRPAHLASDDHFGQAAADAAHQYARRGACGPAESPCASTEGAGTAPQRQQRQQHGGWQHGGGGGRPAGSGTCRRCGAAQLLRWTAPAASSPSLCLPSAAQHAAARRHGTRRQNAAAARYCTRACCGTPSPSLLPLTPRTRPSRTCRASLGAVELSVVKIAEAWRARSRSQFEVDA